METNDNYRPMIHFLITTIAAVVLVGCGESQPTEPPTAQAPDISIHKAATFGNIEAVKQHLAAGTDVNAKDDNGFPPLHLAADRGHTEVVELLITAGADVNAKDDEGETPLDQAGTSWPETADPSANTAARRMKN